MDTNLPDIQNTGGSDGGDDDGLGLIGWLVVGAGGIVAIYVVWWLIKATVSLAIWLLSWGLVALAGYVLYRFVKWMLSDGDSATAASTGAGSHALESGSSEEEFALEDDIEQDLETELSGLQDSELDSLDRDLETSDIERGSSVEDDELEAKFAELERELAQEND